MYFSECQNGSMSPKMLHGTSISGESLASAVRARVLRRLERPHSFADAPSLPAALSFINTKACSLDFQGTTFSTQNETKKNKFSLNIKTEDSRSSEEIETILHQGGPRRSASLADFLFRKKLPKPNVTSPNIIENPMNVT